MKPLTRISFSLCAAIMLLASNLVPADTTLNGWWEAFRPLESKTVHEQGKKMIFRRDGRVYKVERNSCNLLSTYLEEYDHSDQRGTMTLLNTSHRYKSYLAYRLEQDKMIVAFYKDQRINTEAPPNMEIGDNVYLAVSERIPISPCDEPDADYPNVPLTQASYTYDKTKSHFWAVDCDAPKTSGWFLMDERPGRRRPIVIGNSIKMIPYRGLHDIMNVFKDERIKWVSHDEIIVANPDKEWGWPGTRTYHRCKKSTLERLQ
ncbi:MAG: hypothetical protein P8179_16025 [Candidatus Thiodiazotropha sp.]